MSRNLSPFVRHVGEAKNRSRQLVLAAGRAEEAAIAFAGLSGSDDDLRQAIAAVREQLVMLERQAKAWRAESEVWQGGQGPVTRR